MMRHTSETIADVTESDAAFPAGKIPDSLCQGMYRTGTARQGCGWEVSLPGSGAGWEEP